MSALNQLDFPGTAAGGDVEQGRRRIRQEFRSRFDGRFEEAGVQGTSGHGNASRQWHNHLPSAALHSEAIQGNCVRALQDPVEPKLYQGCHCSSIDARPADFVPRKGLAIDQQRAESAR